MGQDMFLVVGHDSHPLFPRYLKEKDYYINIRKKEYINTNLHWHPQVSYSEVGQQVQVLVEWQQASSGYLVIPSWRKIP